MKKMFPLFLFFLLALSGCKSFLESSDSYAFKVVGSSTAQQAYVYLCGLLTDFIPDQMPELEVLDAVGKQINSKLVVLIPTKRCANLGNRLCWPQDNKQEILQTYQTICNSVQNQTIAGYIGFSNGGFFLNQLSQLVELNKPIISIGSAGPVYFSAIKNEIYLLIGKQDTWHYEHAIEFYKQSKKSQLIVHLCEYAQGHQLPEDLLRKVLASCMSQHSP